MEAQILAHYRILRQLGQGGMGEVYLAEDTRLKRQVALKMLPEGLRRDPTRLARFKTEAEAAAKLNHPNIAQIYSIEEANGVLFITIEYVDGQPLYAHIPPQGLSLERFFEWFIPLADAMAHAHERGVTHRDLKPGNIMVSKDGVSKILDFGLARIKRPEPGEVDHDAPTKSVPPHLTQRGTVLGTAGYMSPEQAQGQEVDERSDIFSFGIVLYEAVTGQRPFKGESYISLISSLLKDEPQSVTALKPELPRDVGKVVRKCLQKDLRRRYQSMLDVRNDLDDVKRDINAGTVVLDTGTVGPRGPSVEAPLRKFQLSIAGTMRLWDRPAISPDGTMVAYTVGGRLWIRRLDHLAPQEIADSDGASQPFWSPQSDFVGYIAGSTLKKVSVHGGSSITLCRLRGNMYGATWEPKGSIIVSQGLAITSSGLYTMSVQGGNPQLLIQPNEGELGFYFPHILPDGQTLMFSVWKPDSSFDLVIQAGETRICLLRNAGMSVTCAPSGHLLYQQELFADSEIWAVPFSLSTLTVTGEPFLVAQQGEYPSVSTDGTLVYKTVVTTDTHQLVWVDRSGKTEDTIGQPQKEMRSLALSSDGRRVAVSAVEGDSRDIWIHDVARGTKTRLTFNPINDWQPAWSPADDQIAYNSEGEGRSDMLVQAADGSDEPRPLVASPLALAVGAPNWSGDGHYLIFHKVSPKGVRELWYQSLTEDQQPVPFLQTPFNTLCPVFSPDGRYVAYHSDESGRLEVYVKSFPSGSGKWQVSVNGGMHPRWSSQGDELFYVEGNTLVAVKIDTRSGFNMELPHKLFIGEQVGAQLCPAPNAANYTVTADGQRFVVMQNVSEGTTAITVVQNWVAEFKK